MGKVTKRPSFFLPSSIIIRFLVIVAAVSAVTSLSTSSSATSSSKATNPATTSTTTTWTPTNNATTTSACTSSSLKAPLQEQRKTSSTNAKNKSDKMGNVLFSSYSSSSSTSVDDARRHRREPNIVEKLLRRLTVFRVAGQVFVEYKLAKWKANKQKKRLGISLDDPNGDDHPEIIKLWSKVHDKNALRLLKQIKSLAGFWVKVGQYLSTRADIMPPEYLRSLSELQDSMPPKPWKDTLATIQEELGEEVLLEKFESIDVEPLSTASLAQVHRATLKEKEGDDDKKKANRHVVLKVQHRGVASLMLQDMENLRVILELLAKTDPDLDFSAVIREYNQEVKKELDFRTEAENMKEVSRLLKKNQVQVIIPETIPDLVTERVLVMDFCQGFPIKDTHLYDDVDRELLLERVCAAWAVQMHMGGLFNADPHGANILVSTAVPGDASVPVLLDFGLTKRLEPPIKLAFARLMHASHEGDVDALIQSFDEMGLKMNRHDPFEDMAAMQRGFGNTVPKTQARQVQKQKSADYKRRTEAQRAEAGLEKGQKLRNPVEAWPSELVFFGRVTNMLRGLCSQLEVSYPYLETMAMAAKETIKASVPLEEHADDLVHSSAHALSTPLQRRLLDELAEIETNGIVGLQVCVLQNGKEIANIAAGTIGIANPRPVTPSTLFNIFSVSKGLLTIGLLRLVQDGRIESLDDPVSKYWPAFASNDNYKQQKSQVTVRHLLTHQAGLANVYPEDATLDTLLDWPAMTSFMAEHAEPSHEPGAETQYHALSFAWLVGGLIEAVTGEPYEVLLESILPHHTNTDTDTTNVLEGTNNNNNNNNKKRELYLAGIAKDLDDPKDLAVLSLDRQALKQVTSSKPPVTSSRQEQRIKETGGNDDNKVEENNDDDDDKPKNKKVLAKYRGLQQLMNPSIFNMRKVREAKLPSANGHASAASLAYVFDAVIRPDNPILSKSILEQARIPQRSSSSSFDNSAAATAANNNSSSSTSTSTNMLNDAQASFGLGFQLHEFVNNNNKSTNNGGVKQMSIGHSGLGGSIVLAIPEEQVVVALTVNQLSSNESTGSLARKRLLGIIFEELGWEVPASLPVAYNVT